MKRLKAAYAKSPIARFVGWRVAISECSADHFGGVVVGHAQSLRLPKRIR